jgi:hypothetical protein
MHRALGIGVLVVVAAVIGSAVGLRFYMHRAGENRLMPGEDIAIAKLRAPLPQNAALACPPGYCTLAGAARSPVVALDADRLYWALMRVVTGAPRVTVIADDPRRRRVALLQRSAVFGFPDIVIARVVALAAERSSVALYSRARYGRYDFGVNRRRVEDWLARITAVAQLPAPTAPAAGGRTQAN